METDKTQVPVTSTFSEVPESLKKIDEFKAHLIADLNKAKDMYTFKEKIVLDAVIKRIQEI